MHKFANASKCKFSCFTLRIVPGGLLERGDRVGVYAIIAQSIFSGQLPSKFGNSFTRGKKDWVSFGMQGCWTVSMERCQNALGAAT